MCASDPPRHTGGTSSGDVTATSSHEYRPTLPSRTQGPGPGITWSDAAAVTSTFTRQVAGSNPAPAPWPGSSGVEQHVPPHSLSSRFPGSGPLLPRAARRRFLQVRFLIGASRGARLGEHDRSLFPSRPLSGGAVTVPSETSPRGAASSPAPAMRGGETVDAKFKTVTFLRELSGGVAGVPSPTVKNPDPGTLPRIFRR